MFEILLQCLNSRQCCSGHCSRIINQCIESEGNQGSQSTQSFQGSRPTYQTNKECKSVSEKVISLVVI